MGVLKLSYTASEAFRMMQQNFPDDYQEKINVGKQLIVRLKKIYKKDTYEEAYQRYISSGCREESAIMMLCALQQLVDERKNSLESIVEQQEQIIKQQEYLEADINIKDEDKRMLRQHYKGKLDELSRKFSELCNAIEVIDPVIVNPNLFTQQLQS